MLSALKVKCFQPNFAIFFMLFFTNSENATNSKFRQEMLNILSPLKFTGSHLAFYEWKVSFSLISLIIFSLGFTCQVWSGLLSSNLKKQLENCYFKILRLLCRYFRSKIHWEKLLVDSRMRSLFVIRDVKLLHRFCTSLKPEPIIDRLLSQSYTQSRQDNKLYFYDYSTRKSWRASFINRPF
jgi:hypothetical protein